MNRYDIAIIGGGFGGTLLAMALKSTGLAVVVFEKDRHPRFAIGESSTPLANLILEQLCDEYGLDEVRPLACYGDWIERYPEIRRGPKRGFSFVHHEAGRPFQPRPDYAGEMLVAASPSEAAADTHWYRADVDAFLARTARARGVEVVEGATVEGLERLAGGGWSLRVRPSPTPGAPGGEQEERASGGGVSAGTVGAGSAEDADRHSAAVTAGFVVDATGGAGGVAQALGARPDSGSLRTRSRAVFSHFEHVPKWADVYDALGGDRTAHPYPVDDAALHHLTPEGWVWALRFDHGEVSLGLVTPRESAGLAPDAEWRAFLSRYPSLEEQLGRARPTRPIVSTGWLQRRMRRTAGPDYALMPGAAYFVDPILSPGNAHTLLGVERLAAALGGRVGGRRTGRSRIGGADGRHALAEYDATLQAEIDLIDDLASGCYAAMASPELLQSFVAYYFAGAHNAETERRGGSREAGFLSAGVEELRGAVSPAAEDLRGAGSPDRLDVDAFARRVVREIEPWNRIRLGDPELMGMIPFA